MEELAEAMVRATQASDSVEAPGADKAAEPCSALPPTIEQVYKQYPMWKDAKQE